MKSATLTEPFYVAHCSQTASDLLSPSLMDDEEVAPVERGGRKSNKFTNFCY